MPLFPLLDYVAVAHSFVLPIFLHGFGRPLSVHRLGISLAVTLAHNWSMEGVFQKVRSLSRSLFYNRNINR
jgi:hypothetical protein